MNAREKRRRLDEARAAERPLSETDLPLFLGSRQPERPPAVCHAALDWLSNRGWDLAPLTGQDRPALEAVAHCWELWGRSDTDGRNASLSAIAFLCRGMQEVAWPMARELAAHSLDWGHRAELWPIVCELFWLHDDSPTKEEHEARAQRLRLCATGHPSVRLPDQASRRTP